VRSAVVSFVLFAAVLTVPALVRAAEQSTTTTTATSTTTTPAAGGAPDSPSAAAEPPQTEPASPAESRKRGLAAEGQPAPRSKTPGASASAGGDFPVDMKNFKFSPKTLTVKVGDKVTWSNVTDTAHNVTIPNTGFNKDANKNGDFVSETFDQAGTFDYYCRFHGTKSGTGMAGTIKVEASGGSSGSGGTPSSGDTSGSGGSNGSIGSTSGSGTPASAATTGSSGSLPSTGADLLVLALLGGDLLLAGLVLREALAARRDYS
jgi:plastocyanin